MSSVRWLHRLERGKQVQSKNASRDPIFKSNQKAIAAPPFNVAFLFLLLPDVSLPFAANFRRKKLHLLAHWKIVSQFSDEVGHPWAVLPVSQWEFRLDLLSGSASTTELLTDAPNHGFHTFSCLLKTGKCLTSICNSTTRWDFPWLTVAASAWTSLWLWKIFSAASLRTCTTFGMSPESESLVFVVKRSPAHFCSRSVLCSLNFVLSKFVFGSVFLLKDIQAPKLSMWQISHIKGSDSVFSKLTARP